MAKEVIATDKAPAAIGPYVQATKLGDLVFTSGQIPLDPATIVVFDQMIRYVFSRVRFKNAEWIKIEV